jgi:hypothetical protein
MKKYIFLLNFFIGYCSTAQNASHTWDSIKSQTIPLVAPAFQSQFNAPHIQPLTDYGWEDGAQVSGDGLHLYALYSPSDLFSWTTFFSTHTQLPLCDLLGNMDYRRPYANDYGMDFTTNSFGCDSFANIDILYAHRNSVNDSFATWQLSGIARPGAIEGSPAPLFSETNPNALDLFMFSGNGDLWMIGNTTPNATRLPTPINPVTNEFSADNAFVERINGDTIILVYEKYTDASVRTFMTTISTNLGSTWNTPQAITTITNNLGHIEHPCLYKDNVNQWWLYFSIDYSSIVRAHQTVAGNWDSWSTPETIITKGNAISIGEPTVTKNGDISFVVAYMNTATNDTTDVYDLDPWILPSKSLTGVNTISNNLIQLNAYPSPFSKELTIEFILHQDSKVDITITTIAGEVVQQLMTNEKRNTGNNTIKFENEHLIPGVYICSIKTENSISRKLIVKQ